MNATATFSEIDAATICSALESAAKALSVAGSNPGPIIFFILLVCQRHDQRLATKRAAPTRHVRANYIAVDKLLRSHRRQIGKPICLGRIFAAVYDNSVAHPGSCISCAAIRLLQLRHSQCSISTTCPSSFRGTYSIAGRPHFGQRLRSSFGRSSNDMFHPLFIAFITISTRPTKTITSATTETKNQKSSAVIRRYGLLS